MRAKLPAVYGSAKPFRREARFDFLHAEDPVGGRSPDAVPDLEEHGEEQRDVEAVSNGRARPACFQEIERFSSASARRKISTL